MKEQAMDVFFAMKMRMEEEEGLQMYVHVKIVKHATKQ